ncbi:MAG: TorF family putative porin, partial [Burkholderiaceae bacterium]
GYNKKAAEGEAYVGLSWKTISAKYWYATTNYFGLGDSFAGSNEVKTDGSSYFEVNGTYDLGDGWGVIGHVGLQSIHNHNRFTDVNGNTLAKNVTDYKVGVTKDLSGWLVGLAVVGTSRKDYFGTATSLEAGGKTRALASVSKTF